MIKKFTNEEINAIDWAKKSIKNRGMDFFLNAKYPSGVTLAKTFFPIVDNPYNELIFDIDSKKFVRITYYRPDGFNYKSIDISEIDMLSPDPVNQRLIQDDDDYICICGSIMNMILSGIYSGVYLCPDCKKIMHNENRKEFYDQVSGKIIKSEK